VGYATEQTLTGFSCGQGPLLYYRAAEGACATLETDTVPFGCIEDLEVAPRPPVRMEPGDIFVALSDGMVDAERMGGERFGTARVIELVTRHCRSSAADLTAALRDAALRAYLPPSKDWIFFSASRFFCRPLTCCSISVREEPI